MKECGKCGKKSKFVWDVKGGSYCKRCHPITNRVISLLDKDAVNRSRLPRNLQEYFTGRFVTPALYISDGPVCTHCKQEISYYTWYDNNFPSKAYRYCTKCKRISHKLD